MGSAFTATVGITTQKFHIRDEKPSGTSGQAITVGIWTTRDLNAIVLNEIPGALLSANQMSLPSGTYYIRVRVPSYFGARGRARLRDITNSSNIIVSSSAYGANNISVGDTTTVQTSIVGSFILASQTTIEIQQIRQQTIGTGDGGVETSASGALTEIYTEVELWREIPAVNDGNGMLVNGPLFHVSDEKSPTTHGGTFTLGAWRTRDLNTIKSSAIVGASLSGNTMTLPAGSYYIEAIAPTYFVNQHVTRLRNISGGSTIIVGTTEFAARVATATSMSSSKLSGRFTLSSTTDLELQHRCITTRTPNGFGTYNSFETSVYSEVRIWKLVRAGANNADVVNSPLLHVRDEKASGTNGGALTAGSWQTRVLNTTKTAEIDGSSLSSNQITLPAGSYYVEATAPAYFVANHKAKLRDTTGAADLVVGSSEYSQASLGVGTATVSFVTGRFTLATASVLELQHWSAATNVANGLGVQTTTGAVEVYAAIRIWKLSD